MLDDKPIKIKLKGWVEADDKEPVSNIPKRCKYCNEKMCKVDALQILGLYMVWCPNSRCRWCVIFEE